jgi:DNA-binding GntR family transcriptional regulator
MMKDEKNAELRRQPKYMQLADHISHMIETGQWKPGDRLPSEAEMAKTLPTSLGTIQKALGRLAEHGAVVREHYRGTFVKGPRSLLGPWHLRFLDDDGKTLLPINQKVLGIEKVSGKEPWESFLGKSSFFVCIKRLIDVNGEFNALSFFYVSGDKFGNLLAMPVNELDGMYMRAILRSRFGTPTLRLVEEVTCEAMPDDICQSLSLARDSVGMVFHIMSYGYREEPVSYHLVYVPPNKRRLELRSSNNLKTS